jgi:hypothetical protein
MITTSAAVPANLVNPDAPFGPPPHNSTWGRIWSEYNAKNKDVTLTMALDGKATFHDDTNKLAAIFAKNKIVAKELSLKNGARLQFPKADTRAASLKIGKLLVDKKSTIDLSQGSVDVVEKPELKAGATIIVRNGATGKEAAEILVSLFGGAENVPDGLVIKDESGNDLSDATYKALEALNNPPTPPRSSGGCDAGAFGLFGAAIAVAMLRKKD